MKLFVWDFHGTLERGNEGATLEISNKILEQLGYSQRLTKKENLKLYGKKWYEYFTYILPNEPAETHFSIQQKCIEYETEHPQIINKHIKPNNNAHFVLDEISKKHKQILISNVSDVALSRFIKAVNMNHIFNASKAFATNSYKKQTKLTKIEILKDYLKDKNFDQVITIGDTHIDVEMGQAVGAITYLYAHPGRKFHPANPRYKIRDLRKVLKEM